MATVRGVQMMVEHLITATYNPEKRFRARNQHRDRAHALEFVHSWTNLEFYRQFRLERKELDGSHMLCKIAQYPC